MQPFKIVPDQRSSLRDILMKLALCEECDGEGLIRDCIPPVSWRLPRRIISSTGYFGSYPDWRSAQQAPCGYDSGLILERVKEARCIDLGNTFTGYK